MCRFASELGSMMPLPIMYRATLRSVSAANGLIVAGGGAGFGSALRTVNGSRADMARALGASAVC